MKMTIGALRGKKIKPDQVDEAVAKESRAGPYLGKHDLPTNGFVRSGITNKVLVMACGIFASIAVIEGIAITMMLPLYKVVPVFVTFSDKADQVVRIEPPSGRIASIKILAEQNVREYITMRNSITTDATETVDRWGGRVRLMSSEAVYARFLEETKPVYDEMSKGNFTRSIAIRTILETSPNFYQVEFESFDRRQGQGLADTEDTKTTWVAQLRINYQPRNVSYSQRNLNVFGFTVTDYSVARKRT